MSGDGVPDIVGVVNNGIQDEADDFFVTYHTGNDGLPEQAAVSDLGVAVADAALADVNVDGQMDMIGLVDGLARVLPR